MAKAFYNEDYFRNAGHGNYEYRKRYFNLIASKLIQEFHPKRVLDIGCTGGDLICAMRQLNIDAIGIDVNQYALHHSIDEIKGYVIAIGDNQKNFPIKNDSFDMVTSLEVIEHLNYDNILNLLSELRRILNPNGILFLTTPTPPMNEKVWEHLRFLRESEIHKNVHTEAFWIKLLESNGFKYIGNLENTIGKAAYLNINPCHMPIINLLLKFGFPGRLMWSIIAKKIRGSFLFQLEY